MTFNYNNWKQYEDMFQKYISLLKDNPYVNELYEDLDKKRLQRIIQYFSKMYQDWFISQLNEENITNSHIIKINNLFNDDKFLKEYCHHLMKKVPIGNIELLLNYINKNEIHLDTCDKIISKIELNPSSLKFVTTTAICFLDTHVDFKELYNRFIAPDNILKDISENIYNDEMLGKIVGCKTGNLPIKGHFKKKTLGDFYNCATINLVINNTKDCNIKIFNNGKLQMTGIPKEEIGIEVCESLCKNIKLLIQSKEIENKNPLVVDLKRLCLKSYNTVMMNTCYEIGHMIDRETLFKYLLNTYKLNAIFDSEGYPGVRIEYYYNINNINTEFEGRCICTETCKGKGKGNGDKDCRKISVAIFQSGSAIIAGGCSKPEPIYAAYNFVNNILQTISEFVIKTDNHSKKNKKKQEIFRYIEINKLTNPDIYVKIIDSINSANVKLDISNK